uniref:Ovule protein n=1 Tax=Parascaris univalens TaxID=6257 RepID=A0A915BC09_PARUN
MRVDDLTMGTFSTRIGRLAQDFSRLYIRRREDFSVHQVFVSISTRMEEKMIQAFAIVSPIFAIVSFIGGSCY